MCETRGLIYEEMEPFEICVAIKQAFAKVRIYINTDSERNLTVIRERYPSWKMNR